MFIDCSTRDNANILNLLNHAATAMKSFASLPVEDMVDGTVGSKKQKSEASDTKKGVAKTQGQVFVCSLGWVFV